MASETQQPGRSDALSPGWTVYGRRLQYLTYDVTSYLAAGRNAIGAWLGQHTGDRSSACHRRHVTGLASTLRPEIAMQPLLIRDLFGERADLTPIGA